MRGKAADIEFTPRFVPVGVLPPPRNATSRLKYGDTLDNLKKHEGQWCELVSFPKAEVEKMSGALYSRRQTISSFEGYEAQVRRNKEDHTKHPAGVSLWAAFKPAAAKGSKKNGKKNGKAEE